MTFSRRSLLQSGLAAPALFALPADSLAQTAVRQSQARSARFRVGEIEVIALSDGFLPLPVGMMQGYEPAAAEAAARDAYQGFNGEFMRLGINGYVIRTAGQVVAVDNGTPSLVGDTVGGWRGSLAQAGIAPEDIDIAFQTHLHMDHIGGLGDVGTGEAALPNAQLIVSEAEWAFTHSDAAYAQAPETIQTSFELARALVAPYADDALQLPMSRETEIAPGLTAVPLPGHTPGHMGLRVSSGAETLLIWGDAMHVQAFQFAHPSWSLVFDADRAQAEETRVRLMDMAAAERLRVAGSHIDFPSLGHVERAGSAYRFIPGGADYG